MPYSDWLVRLVPQWLQRDWAGGVVQAIAEELDELTDEMVQARRAFMPGFGKDDALPLIGQERQLEQGPTETNAAYAARLVNAWGTLERMGSHPALHQQLQALGFDTPNMFIIQRSGRRTELDGSGNLVVADGPHWAWSAKPDEAYAEFGLLFTTAQPAITWDSVNGYSSDALKLDRIAQRWRPAKAEYMGTIILQTGAWWGWPVTRTWGSFNYGGTSSFIPPTQGP
jgi:hypothetical protein